MNRQEIKHILTNHYVGQGYAIKGALVSAEAALVEYEKMLQPCIIIGAEYPEGYCTVHESDADSSYSDKCDAAKSVE